jgi:hypothetical protein
LRKELHDDSPSLIPHPKKSRRISLKVKERVTHELKKKKKKHQEGPAATPAPPGNFRRSLLAFFITCGSS